MKTLTDYLSSYGRFHTKSITKITHFIGVPLVVFSLLILLGWFHLSMPTLFSINFAWLTVIAVSIFYIRLDWQLGLSLCLIFVIMTLIANVFSQPNIHLTGVIVFLTCFIFGWIFQLIGHIFEGKQPAFLTNLMQVFIAPLFLAAEVACYFQLRKDLQNALQ